MPIGAIVAGGLGAAGAIGGALINSSAADKASQQQATSAQNALAQQKSMFGTAQNALNPYINAGQSVLPSLQSLITPGSSAQTLQTLPGFQFQSQWGNLAATNQLSAEGLGGSTGPVAKAVSDYNQGLAGTYYQNSVNALQQYANMGLGAGSALAGDAINSGNAIAGTQQAIGSAQAAGTLGSANALSGGISGATGSISNALLLSKILGGSNSGIYNIAGGPGDSING